MLPLLMLLGLGGCYDKGDNVRGLCQTSADCGVGEDCFSGRCSPVATGRCQDDSDCPASLTCDGGACVARREQADHPLCSSSGNCSSDEVCLVGRCRQTACMESNQCPGDAVCVAGLCRYAPFCESEGDCALVYGACEDGRCEPGCSTNRECGGSSNTACELGECVLTCASTQQCETGQRCIGGLCRADVCEGFSSEGCPPGERCDGAGQCEPLRICFQDVHCDSNERCEEGLCESRWRCSRDRDCADLGTGRCEEGFCTIARACSGLGQPCLGGERCIAGACSPDGCRHHAECPGAQRCEQGGCRDVQIGSALSTIKWRTSGVLLFPGEHTILQATPVDPQGMPDSTGRALRAELSAEGPWTLSGDGPWRLDVDQELETAANVSVVFRHRNGNGEVLRVGLRVMPRPVDQRSLRVIDARSGEPIAGATVRWRDAEAVTDNQGLALSPLVTIAPDTGDGRDDDDSQGDSQAGDGGGAPDGPMSDGHEGDGEEPPEQEVDSEGEAAAWEAVEIDAVGFVSVAITGLDSDPVRVALEPLNPSSQRVSGYLEWPESAPDPTGAWVSLTLSGLSDGAEPLTPWSWFGGVVDVSGEVTDGSEYDLSLVEAVTLQLFTLGLGDLKDTWSLPAVQSGASLRMLRGSLPLSTLNEVLGRVEDISPLSLPLRLLSYADLLAPLRFSQGAEAQLVVEEPAPHRVMVRAPSLGVDPTAEYAMLVRCDQTDGLLPSVPLMLHADASITGGSSLNSLVTMDGLAVGMSPLNITCWLHLWESELPPGQLWPESWTTLALRRDRLPTELQFASTPSLAQADYEHVEATWHSSAGSLHSFVWWGELSGGQRRAWLHLDSDASEASLPDGVQAPQGGSVYWFDSERLDPALRLWPLSGELRAVEVQPAP